MLNVITNKLIGDNIMNSIDKKRRVLTDVNKEQDHTIAVLAQRVEILTKALNQLAKKIDNLPSVR